MNGIINKFLLEGDNFMPKIYLRQPRFTYSACGPFAKHKERIQIFKAIWHPIYFYQDELDKSCSQHERAYANFKDRPRGAVSDSIVW